MLLASLQDVTSHYGIQEVLKGVSFTVSTGQKLGLIGANGTGKSTILRVLLGQAPPSDGQVVLSRNVSVGYVPQVVEYEEEETVLHRVLGEHHHLARDLREQEARLATVAEEDLQPALQAFQRARDAYDNIDGDRLPQRAEANA